MRATIRPQTTQGKWSAGFAITFIILIGAKMQDFMPLPTFAIAVLGLSGLVLALIAVFRHGDRSVSCLLAILVGLVIVLWIAAELMFPH